jgi:PAS domain S-box-containing protein
MKVAPIPANEKERLEKLYEYQILDTDDESKFDQITKTVAKICDVKIALISLIDSNRQWFKSRFGLEARETPRDISFCGHAIMGDEIFEIPDAELDSRFCDNPLFLNEPHVRFYAGMPLVTSDNFRIGTLCVIDSKSKKLSDEQKEILKVFAANIVELFELRIKNKKLEFVFSNISEGYFERYLNNDYEYMSPRFWEILGYDPKQKKHQSSERKKLIHPDDLKSKQVILDLHIKSKGKHPFQMDIRYLHACGQYVWLRVEGKVVEWSKSGEALRMVGTHLDIDVEKRKSHEALTIKKGIEEYAITSHTDKNGRITYANPLFCKISKYTEEELLGQDHRMLNSGHHPKSFFKEMWSAISAKKSWRGEVKNRAKDGTFYWVDTTIIPITSLVGDIEGFVSFRYDITHAKLAEFALAESENRHKQLFIQSRDAVMTLSPPNWQFTSCNDATLKLFNVSSEQEFIKLGPWDISPQYQASGELSSYAAPKAIKKAMEEGSNYFEWIHQTVDGTKITCMVLLSRVCEGEMVYLQATVRDISKSIKQEKELKLVLEGNRIGIWKYDPVNNSLEWDKSMYELYGMDKSKFSGAYDAWATSLDASSRDVAMKELEDAIMGKKDFDTTFAIKTPQGETRYIKAKAIVERDEHGKALMLLGVNTDITKIKLAEIETKKLSSELNKFFELSLNYLCIANSKAFFTKLGTAWQNLGYTEEELLSRPLTDFIHPDDLGPTTHEIQKLSQGQKTICFENRYKKKDGKHIQFEWNASKDPETGLIYAVASDVTERKKREEINLILSQLRSNFINLSTDKKKFFDYLLNKIITLTGSEYGFIGEVLEDENGKYLKTYAITDISWNEETRNFFQKNAPGGLEFKNLDTLFGEVLKTGELLIANDAPNHPKASGVPRGHPPLNRFMGVPINYNGKIFAMIGVANNKQGYQKEEYDFLRPFFELIGEMIQSVKLSVELENQKKISYHNAKLASIGELAAGVGHEINNPLAIIHGQMLNLKRFCEQENIVHEQINSKIEKSLKGIDRISNIVKSLRTFARADDSDLKSMNISQLLIETKDMLAEIYEKDEINLVFDIEKDIWVKGNFGRLQQVFVNLLNNARDALVGCVNKKIQVSAALKNNELTIKIFDNGPGVPPELREKIFDPFFTTKEVNKGTGIGLALVSTILKEHEGVITLDSEYKDGACFKITLLAMPSANVLIQTQLDKKLSSDKKVSGKVLIVDDEKDLQEILKDMLESYGLSIVTASNGKEALEYMNEHYNEIDLILSDMKMPVMSGLEFVRALKKANLYNGKIVLITGGVNVSVDEYKELVDGILPKPFEEDKAMLTIQSLIKKNK